MAEIWSSLKIFGSIDEAVYQKPAMLYLSRQTRHDINADSGKYIYLRAVRMIIGLWGDGGFQIFLQPKYLTVPFFADEIQVGS